MEDERAFEAGINNRVTANGLVQVLRAHRGGHAFSLLASDADAGDPARRRSSAAASPPALPDDARVANKTGEISTVAHDAGIVYLPDRKPYVLVVLTEWDARRPPGGSDTIARISRAVYEHLTPAGARTANG